MKIPHVFFNGNNWFNCISHRLDWKDSYIAPYLEFTYNEILRDQFEPVSVGSWHFGKDAHCFWAEFVLQYCIENNILDPHAISPD